MTTVYVEAAYGRKYKNKADVQKDWAEDKDFKIHAGPYINRPDAVASQARVIYSDGKLPSFELYNPFKF